MQVAAFVKFYSHSIQEAMREKTERIAALEMQLEDAQLEAEEATALLRSKESERKD